MTRLAVLAIATALAACSGNATHDDGGDEGAPPEDAGADARSGDADADAPHGDAGGGDADLGPVDGGVDFGPTVWFRDVTVESGIDFARTPAEGWTTLPDRIGGGVCPIDADGAPPIDLFFAVRPGPLSRSHLYVASATLAYADETSLRGLDDVGDAQACLAYDEDGDGDDDLVVTGNGSVRLFHNDAGHFTDDSAMLNVGLDVRDIYMGASAGDVDRDGDLDLIVAGYVHFDPERFPMDFTCTLGVPCPIDLLGYDGIPSLVLARAADGTYTNVTASLAPNLARTDMTFLTRVSTLIGDGPPQIYVGNDLGTRFQDYLLDMPVGDTQYVDRSIDFGFGTDAHGYGIDTMGFSAGDFDGDGVLDYVESTFYSQQTVVFMCDPSIEFCEDRSTAAGLGPTLTSFRWGEAAADYDLDGHDDFVEATGGYYTRPEATRLHMSADPIEPMNLAHGRGDGTFELVTPEAADGLAPLRATRGISVVDLDDDGRPDVVAAPSYGALVVLHNVHAPVGHFLRVLVVGQGLVRDPAGAHVLVRQSGRTFVRDRAIGEGFLGNFDRRLLFGLPDASPVDIDVRWPDGTHSAMTGVAVDGDVTINQP